MDFPELLPRFTPPNARARSRTSGSARRKGYGRGTFSCTRIPSLAAIHRSKHGWMIFSESVRLCSQHVAGLPDFVLCNPSCSPFYKPTSTLPMGGTGWHGWRRTVLPLSQILPPIFLRTFLALRGTPALRKHMSVWTGTGMQFLDIHFLDVGHGDCTVVNNPSG